MPVNHNRSQVGYFDAHPPRDAYAKAAEPATETTEPEPAEPEQETA
jgi:hypothetical protein